MTNVISELRNTTESSKLYKLRKFLASDYFCALVVLYSVAVICFNWIIPGAFVLALITGFVFFFSDDIVSVFLPIMLIASFGIQANDSLWDYMALAPVAAFPIFAILFHHIFFDNDLWILYPDKDQLINIMQEDVFSDAAMWIAGIWLAAAALFAAASAIILLRDKSDAYSVNSGVE